MARAIDWTQTTNGVGTAPGTRPTPPKVIAALEFGSYYLRPVGTVRREVLDHVIPLNDQHLRRLGREYIAYYQEDQTHIGLEKTTPAGRTVEPRPTEPRQPRASTVFIIGTLGRRLRDQSLATVG